MPDEIAVKTGRITCKGRVGTIVIWAKAIADDSVQPVNGAPPS